MSEKGIGTEKTAKLKENTRRQLGMLTSQFLLGMAVNLIGMPSEVSGVAKTFSSIFLILHLIVASGLVFGAVTIGMIVRKADKSVLNLARYGSAAIGLAVIAGLLTYGTKSNWWSYLMAIGFIASVGIYGSLYRTISSGISVESKI